MIAVSDRWKEIHQQTLLPEMYVEVSCEVTEMGAQETAVASATNEEYYSEVESITQTSKQGKYATLEPNLWVLDGTCDVLSTEEPYSNPCYVGQLNSEPKLTLSFPEVRTVTVPGITITWSEAFGEYATSFTVTAKNGDTVIASKTVEGNTDVTSYVDLEIINYDTIEVEVHDWCLPDRRVRTELLYSGYLLTYTKDDLLSFTHEQTGDLNSGALPKNMVTFSINNIDGRWNPLNPSGLEQYLSERQRVTVKYGMDVDGEIEWIPGGVFYLSEWEAPSTTLEARFIARDLFEFLQSKEYPYDYDGTTGDFIMAVVEEAALTDTNTVMVDQALIYEVTLEAGRTCGEIVQLCANAEACVLRIDRAGILYIEPMNTTTLDYKITSHLSYTQPNVTLSTPLKSVRVAYSDRYKMAFFRPNTANNGEAQTVDNPLIHTFDQAEIVASWTWDTLASRKTINGEFRADPRLDVFDVITVESKYGDMTPVAITSIKYTFSGSFRAAYTGRVLSLATT